MQWITDRAAGLAEVNAVDVVTLLSLVVASLQLARAQPKRVLRRYRRRYLRPLGVTRRDVDARVAVLVAGVAVSAADEVSWLADRLRVAPGRSLPFDAERVTAQQVEAAYQKYVARLQRGVLFGKSHVPVVEADLTRCRAVAVSMWGMKNTRRIETRELTLEVPHRRATLTLHAQAGPDFAVRDLAVSYRRERVVTIGVATDAEPQGDGANEDDAQDYGAWADEQHTLTVKALACTADERTRLAAALRTGRFFDGVLPRLIGWRVERDQRSGREVLHLSLAECTYSTVVLDHYPRELLTDSESDPPRPVRGDRVGVLTLSATVVTASGLVVFARRSASAGSHRRQYGPAINGNLEFESRTGLTADLDPAGWPDLRAALAREGREELGLDIEAAQVSVLGLGGFTVPEEVGSHVLLGQHMSDLTLPELVGRLRHADPIEGAWELDGALLGLRLPETADELIRAVSWLVGSTELTPHATLAGLATLAVSTGVSDVWQMAEQSVGRNEPVQRPTDLVTEVSVAGRGAASR